tara:strand:- start:280 stop:1986 length:1707 start_codon:yes stop_codon:yes gene_type:complete
MAIDQIGVAAAIPQQYEEVITSSTNWSVPVGVKSVEYIAAGGGGNGSVRGGIAFGLYNVDGRSTIPLVIGAKATSTGLTGGTTTFDGSIVCTGGKYVSSTSANTGNVVNLTTDSGNSISGYTPIQGKTDYGFASGTGTVGYFAAFDGKAIAISTDGQKAMYSIDDGDTWTEVASITNAVTGDPISFGNVLNPRNMRMDHNKGNAWVLRQEGGSWLAYTLDNGLNWKMRSLGFTFYDAIIAGDNNSTAAMVSTTGGVQRTTDLAVGSFSIASSDRVDMFFRTTSTNGQYFIGLDGTDSYYTYSSNNGSTWSKSTSSISSLRNGNVNRYSKSYSGYRTTAVVEQRGLNSNYISGYYQNGSNNYFSYQTYYNVDSNNSNVNGTSPSGNYGNNNMGMSAIQCWKPQTLSQNFWGVNFAWFESNDLRQQNPGHNYSYWNISDGGLSVGSFTSPHIGGQNYYDTSRYLVAELPGTSGSQMMLYSYSGTADGNIYSAKGYEGMGTDYASSQNGQQRYAADAMGVNFQSSYNTTYPAYTIISSSGIDGWGRNSSVLSGLGYGGVNQDGGVRLRWWA